MTNEERIVDTDINFDLPEVEATGSNLRVQTAPGESVCTSCEG